MMATILSCSSNDNTHAPLLEETSNDKDGFRSTGPTRVKKIDAYKARVIKLDEQIKIALTEFRMSSRTADQRDAYHRQRNAMYSRRKYYKRKYLTHEFERDKKYLQERNAALRANNKTLETLLCLAEDQVKYYNARHGPEWFHAGGLSHKTDPTTETPATTSRQGVPDAIRTTPDAIRTNIRDGSCAGAAFNLCDSPPWSIYDRFQDHHERQQQQKVQLAADVNEEEHFQEEVSLGGGSRNQGVAALFSSRHAWRELSSKRSNNEGLTQPNQVVSRLHHCDLRRMSSQQLGQCWERQQATDAQLVVIPNLTSSSSSLAHETILQRLGTNQPVRDLFSHRERVVGDNAFQQAMNSLLQQMTTSQHDRGFFDGGCQGTRGPPLIEQVRYSAGVASRSSNPVLGSSIVRRVPLVPNVTQMGFSWGDTTSIPFQEVDLRRVGNLIANRNRELQTRLVTTGLCPNMQQFSRQDPTLENQIDGDWKLCNDRTSLSRSTTTTQRQPSTAEQLVQLIRYFGNADGTP